MTVFSLGEGVMILKGVILDNSDVGRICWS